MSKAGKKIIKAAQEAVDVAKGKKKATMYSVLDLKKHGVGGLIKGPIKLRKQDRRASPGEFYIAAFFPKVHGVGKATLGWHSNYETLSKSPAAAKVKFIDRMAKGESWTEYEKAGWRIRKVKISDMGDA